jgi:hypothetical protein
MKQNKFIKHLFLALSLFAIVSLSTAAGADQYMGIPAFSNAEGKATNPAAGAIWYNSTDNHLYFYNGSVHVKISMKGLNTTSFDSTTNEITFNLDDGTSQSVNLDPIAIGSITAENGEIVIVMSNGETYRSGTISTEELLGQERVYKDTVLAKGKSGGVEVSCNPGKVVMGGGGEVTDGGAAYVLSGSFPTSDSSWSSSAKNQNNSSGGTLRVWAICVNR